MKLTLPAWAPRQAYLNGKWIDAPKSFAVADPATGFEIARVPNLDAADVNRAIDAAHTVQRDWAATTTKERSAILRRWFDLVIERAEEISSIITAEQGKPLQEARAEVAYGAAFIEWFAEEGKRAYGRSLPIDVRGKRFLTLKQPVGLAAAITPWNFPMAMITRKVAPALAAGCVIIIKPSEEAPLTALALAKLAEIAGLPAGVLSILTTMEADGVGRRLCEDARVRKLSFTGSTSVGKTLYARCATTVKRLSLELGGNAPLIVFDDASVEVAVAGVVASKFRNAGQTCVCANRILVQARIHDRFVEALSEAVRSMSVGPGANENTIGPLINDRAHAKVTALVADALKHDASIVVGGGAHDAGPRFFEPTILTNITSSMAISQQEIFGPVAPIIRFEDSAEAIRIANCTPHGLAAYVFTRDIAQAWRIAENLEAGMVGVNEGILSSEATPFGGVKESGIGREGGVEGLDEYLETKLVCFGGTSK